MARKLISSIFFSEILLVILLLNLTTVSTANSAQELKFSPKNDVIGSKIMITLSEGMFNLPIAKVEIGGVAAPIVTEKSDHLIVTVLSSTKNGPISITDSRGVNTTSKEIFKVKSIIISKIYPLNGSPGIPIAIEGKNFEETFSRNIVEFAGGKQATIISGNSSLLVVSVPDDAATGFITVKNSRGDYEVSDVEFVIDSPTITNADPQSGYTGLPITLNGKNLDKVFSNNEVFFYNNKKASIISGDTTYLKVIVPEGVETGVIKVSNSKGSNPSLFSFVITDPPKIKRLVPVSGSPGTTVVIIGEGFGPVEDIKVKFDGFEATVDTDACRNPKKVNTDACKNPNRLEVKVPHLDVQPCQITVSNTKGSGLSKTNFDITHPENALHLYGGGTVNYWGDPSGDDTTKEILPLFGVIGVHKFQLNTLKGFNTINRNGGIFLEGELSYRDVAADKAIATNQENGVSLDGLSSAKSIGIFSSLYYPVISFDTCFLGPKIIGGGEFLTDDNYKRDVQYSAGVNLRLQDNQNPSYYAQVGYGRTEYLEGKRYTLDFSFPIISGILGDKKKQAVSFYDPDFTEYYFFGSVNTGLRGNEHADDVLTFGIKAVISASKLFGIFDSDKIFTERKVNELSAE